MNKIKSWTRPRNISRRISISTYGNLDLLWSYERLLIWVAEYSFAWYHKWNLNIKKKAPTIHSKIKQFVILHSGWKKSIIAIAIISIRDYYFLFSPEIILFYYVQANASIEIDAFILRYTVIRRLCVKIRKMLKYANAGRSSTGDAPLHAPYVCFLVNCGVSCIMQNEIGIYRYRYREVLLPARRVQYRVVAPFHFVVFFI